MCSSLPFCYYINEFKFAITYNLYVYRMCILTIHIKGAIMGTCVPSIHPRTKENPQFCKKASSRGFVLCGLKIVYTLWPPWKVHLLLLQYIYKLKVEIYRGQLRLQFEIYRLP